MRRGALRGVLVLVGLPAGVRAGACDTSGLAREECDAHGVHALLPGKPFTDVEDARAVVENARARIDVASTSVDLLRLAVTPNPENVPETGSTGCQAVKTSRECTQCSGRNDRF